MNPPTGRPTAYANTALASLPSSTLASSPSLTPPRAVDAVDIPASRSPSILEYEQPGEDPVVRLEQVYHEYRWTSIHD